MKGSIMNDNFLAKSELITNLKDRKQAVHTSKFMKEQVKN